MGIRIKIIAFIFGLVFFLCILRYIKKGSFQPSYSVLWVAVSSFLMSIPLLEPLYRWFAYTVIGIQDARHIIYIFLIVFLLGYVFYLTSKITGMSDQIKNLISVTAILRNKINENSKKQVP